MQRGRFSHCHNQNLKEVCYWRAPLYVSKELAFSDSGERETNVTVMKWERQTYWPLWLQRTFAACVAWQLMVRTPDSLTLVASENICCLHCMANDGENARPTDPCGFREHLLPALHGKRWWECQTHWPLWLQRTSAACLAWQTSHHHTTVVSESV